MQHAGRKRARRKIEARREGDRVFRAGIGADPALQAGGLGEIDLRLVGVVAKSRRGAERNAGEAERAGPGIDLHRAVGGARRQGEGAVRYTAERGGGAAHHLAPPAQGQDRICSRLRLLRRAQDLLEPVGLGGRDQRHRLAPRNRQRKFVLRGKG